MNQNLSKLSLGYLLRRGPPALASRLSRLYQASLARLGKLVFRTREDRKRINIGGGRWYKPRWENIDYYANDPYVDYRIDLRLQQGLPIRDECAEMVFSSHCFEHISDEAALFLLGECSRILESGGVVRLAVPDMDKAFEAYYRGDRRFFEDGGVTCKGPTLESLLVNFFSSYSDGGGPDVSAYEVKAKLNELDKYEFCQWCVSQLDGTQRLSHINAYDFTKLASFLRESGFDLIERSEFRQSSVPALRKNGFDNRPVVTLYVEARKPDGSVTPES